MKEILGWKEESDKEPLSKFHFKDRYGKKVFLENNTINRPIYFGTNVEDLCYEVSYKRWRLNGESFIVGESGLILNGQHQGIGFILACQDWERADKDSKIRRLWKNRPTFEKVMVYGIKEDADTRNTMDTAKPRSLADVLFSDGFFAELNTVEKKKASRSVAHSVRLLWSRTGVGEDEAFKPRKTQTELVSFLHHHPRLVPAFHHLYEEDAGKEKRISKWLSLGYASCSLYMMATSGTDTDETGYFTSEEPSEKLVNFDNWDDAIDFWTLLATNEKKVSPIRSAILGLREGGTLIEKLSILAKGWSAWMENEKVTPNDLELEYVADEHEVLRLVDPETFGGIDIGE
jgi:hypothetical protein